MHTHSMRLASGQEALVTRVLTQEGKAYFGFSLQLDATEARHMALFHAGLLGERPRITPVRGHPWETSWVSHSPIEWNFEPAFSRLTWLP